MIDPLLGVLLARQQQTQRPLRSSSSSGDAGVSVIFESGATRGIRQALDQINAHAKGERRSVLVLGRYRSSRKALRPPGALEVEFSTAHSAKGKEADYVVVVDLKDDRMGFPCRVDDDLLLDLALPPLRGKAFPFAEDRRLFYVAMTRARIGAYLVADPMRPSIFVTELLGESDIISRLGDLNPKCARCRTGRLTRSQSGKTMMCSNHPTCDYLAPRCDKCEYGYSLVFGECGRPECTNTSCGHRPRACPQCGIGVVVNKSGPYARFWACSRYRAEPSCSYKESIPSDVSAK